MGAVEALSPRIAHAAARCRRGRKGPHAGTTADGMSPRPGCEVVMLWTQEGPGDFISPGPSFWGSAGVPEPPSRPS